MNDSDQVLHLTQSDFAAICNISQTYLSLIENHKKPVTIDTLHNIATGYMVNLEWLVYGDDNEQIFMSNKVNAEYLSKTHKDEALSTLRSAYSLSAEDIAFIHSFANLSQNERKHLISAIEALKSL